MATATSNIHACAVEKVFRFSFGNRGKPWIYRYKMVDFQRPYVWTQENIQKLLDDVDELRANFSEDIDVNDIYDTENALEYYLGSICLRRCEDSKGKHYEVLDGQQRLTSLLILAYVLDKQVKSYEGENDQKRVQIKEKIVKRWNKIVPRMAGKGKNWKQLVVFTNPQSKKQIAQVYWSFMRDYECLKRDARADKDTKDEDGMNIFEQTLYQDIQRFEYILRKGSVAVLILNNQTEAEQFFQGENNRGLPMSLLDLLKAYHLRQEVVRQVGVQRGENFNSLTEINKLWHSFGFSVEDEKSESDEGSPGQSEYSDIQMLQQPQTTQRLITKLVLPAMLMQYGVDPWSADKLENLPLLKGITGTYARNRFVDEKLKDAQNGIQNTQYFDLRIPVRPGLPFFQELGQYLKLAQAVELFLMKRRNETKSVDKKENGLTKESKREGDEENRKIILKLAMIAWADRFLKADIMRLGCTWTDVADALEKDGDFRIYALNFEHFLDRLKDKKKKEKGKKIGAYVTLRNETLCNIIEFADPENSLVFLPHRSSSPRECLRKFKTATHPGVLKFSDLRFYEGYRNAYDREGL